MLPAMFWTLNSANLETIVEGTRPFDRPVGKKPLLPFLKQKTEVFSTYFNYLNEHGVEEVEFENTGMLISDFDSIVSQQSASIFKLSLPESLALSRHCGGNVAVIDGVIATRIIDIINEANITESVLASYYEGENRPENLRFYLEDIIAAGNHLKLWCSKVSSGKIGVLIIG